jgi:hypothetical protein
MGLNDQIFITVRQLRICWFGAPSLTRGRVCRLQLQLALASPVIFGSESRRTGGHILLSQIWDSPFRRLPTTRRVTVEVFDPVSTRVDWLTADRSSLYSLCTDPTENNSPNSYSIVAWRSYRHWPRRKHRLLHSSGFQQTCHNNQ